MKGTLFTRFTPALLLAFFYICSPVSAQPIDSKIPHSQSVFIEVGGSGCTFSGNYEFRFKPGQSTGPGLRVGIGYFALDVFSKSSVLSVPVEFNYLIGDEHLVAGEIGFSLTYLHLRDESIGWFSDDSEFTTENALVSYIPVGIRLKPDEKGFMFRFNVGPMINYGSSNLWSDNTVDIFLGLSFGYTFVN